MSRNQEFLNGLNFVPTPAGERGLNHTIQAFASGHDGPVGSLRWSRHDGSIFMVQVHPDHQRQGLATELMRRARAFADSTPGVPHPQHSGNRTDAGDAWASSLGDRVPQRTSDTRLPLDVL